MSVHFLRGVRSKCACAMVVPWRYHNTIQHNKTTKDYQNFKTALRATRVMYLNEHKDQEKLLTEDWNSQAAQDARLEKEREAKAFEENEKELQRMAEWREMKKERIIEMKLIKRLQGMEARDKVASKLKELRTQKVMEMNEKSKNFITMENLEDKIEEALANEVNYNFALSISGEKIT